MSRMMKRRSSRMTSKSRVGVVICVGGVGMGGGLGIGVGVG